MNGNDIPGILTKRCTRKLPETDLEARIATFLASRRICVLATCREDTPRATPIEFRARGLTLYMAAEPGTKIRNIHDNPNVSVGLFDPRAEKAGGWDEIEGLQLTGRARLYRKGQSGFFEAYRLFGKPEAWTGHWTGMMLEIVPDRIEYLCMALKREDYAARQVWTRSDA
ncbi:MAG: pyridoxamine 5'-phosphate oxidase family protein [Chlorobiaceae bacterium]|nr:pyridoxamine 5'-phosphate oxidase family protein [Chlorobiaceae bacterium]